MAAALLVVALIAAGLYMALTSAFSPQETAQNGGANATLNASGENAADNGGAQAGGNGSGNSDEGATGGGTTDEQGNDDDAGARRPEKPEAVKGIYLSAYSTANLDAYADFVDSNELNAMVIDVKDVTGEVMYPSEVELAREIGATRDVIPDLEALASDLEERGIYSIARVAVFEDDILPVERPDLAVQDSQTGAQWTNYQGQYWADAYDREVWEYNVAIAKEAAEAGFDEVQFDYVRFPSDGPMENLEYEEETFPTPGDAIAGFLKYAKGELEPTGAYLAADVFGLAAGDDGAGVGQDIGKIAPHLDVICPMAYPSHYPLGSYGYQYPNEEPYGVLENTLAEFEADIGNKNPDLEVRPWIQDFDMGEPEYGPEEIRAQIEAIYDAGHTGWLLWNPANEYTAAALGPPEEEQQ